MPETTLTEVEVEETNDVLQGAANYNPNPTPVLPGATPATGGTPPPQAAGVLTPITDSFGEEDFSWNKSAAAEADLMLQAEEVQAQQNAQAARTNIEKNAGMGQREVVLGKYSAAQTSEKMGWTGGYLVDTDLQLDFLKATIQADMYGQLELQKLGYESSLAIARLNYQLNMKQLADQYYKDARTHELQVASFVGQYISPENRELVTQYAAAKIALENNPDDLRAQGIMNQVKSWYYAEGLDDDGIEALLEISQLTRNEQAYDLNALTIEEIEFNMAYAEQEAVNEINEQGLIPAQRTSANGTEVWYGISPDTTDESEMAIVYEYFKDNPEAYKDILKANETLDFAEYAAALPEGEAPTSEGFEAWMATNGSLVDDYMARWDDYMERNGIEGDPLLETYEGQYANIATVVTNRVEIGADGVEVLIPQVNLTDGTKADVTRTVNGVNYFKLGTDEYRADGTTYHKQMPDGTEKAYRMDGEGNMFRYYSELTDLDEIFNDVNLTEDQQITAAKRIATTSNIELDNYKGVNEYVQLQNYQRVQNYVNSVNIDSFSGMTDAEKKSAMFDAVANLYGSLEPIKLNGNGKGDDEEIAGMINAVLYQLYPDLEGKIGFAGIPQFMGIGENGWELVDGNGKAITDESWLDTNLGNIAGLGDMASMFKSMTNSSTDLRQQGNLSADFTKNTLIRDFFKESNYGPAKLDDADYVKYFMTNKNKPIDKFGQDENIVLFSTIMSILFYYNTNHSQANNPIGR